MTKDGQLTKDEIQSVVFSLKKETYAVRLVASVETEEGETLKTDAGEVSTRKGTRSVSVRMADVLQGLHDYAAHIEQKNEQRKQDNEQKRKGSSLV